MQLDPELAAVLPFIPPQDFADIDHCRRLSADVNPPFDPASIPDIVFRNYSIETESGNLLIRVCMPTTGVRSAATILHIHGGGFCTGRPEFDDSQNAEIVHSCNVIVVSPAYRLAPEHPYPAAFNDCCDTLSWLLDPHCPLPVDKTRIAVMGHSAGGGLAAAVALWARDTLSTPLAAQLLLEPELDHRLETDSMKSGINTPIWYLSNAERSWQYYLDGSVPDIYASPALADSLAGLPRTYLTINQVDPLRDEGLDYAQRLLRAGVPTELHCWPGAYHGFMAVASARISRHATAEVIRIIRTYLAPILPASACEPADDTELPIG